MPDTTTATATPTALTDSGEFMTADSLRTIVGAARANAKPGPEAWIVDRAETAVEQLAKGERSYASAAALVLPLEAIATRATTSARAFVDGVVFIESGTTAGVFYRCVGASCTCPAGQHGRSCKHLAAAAKGEGWRAAMPKAVQPDPFAKVQR